MTARTAAGGCVLGVGIATLDLINEVADYPLEDSEVRCLSQRQARGGNVTNTLTVLAQIGHHCRWAGTLADDLGADFIQSDLGKHGISLDSVVRIAGANTPTSTILLSRATGSRTICHHRDLRELTAADFEQVSLDGLDWVHFEGRNPLETQQMLARVRKEAPFARISVELEKPRSDIEALMADADLLLIGRAFAQTQAGEKVDPARYLAGLANRTGIHALVLGWGAQGAWLLTPGDTPALVSAFSPPRVVDTIGAGDALNAGVIDALLGGQDLYDAVSHGVHLAGVKCGQIGFDGLGTVASIEGSRTRRS